jgi:hypothetical protein
LIYICKFYEYALKQADYRLATRFTISGEHSAF